MVSHTPYRRSDSQKTRWWLTKKSNKTHIPYKRNGLPHFLQEEKERGLTSDVMRMQSWVRSLYWPLSLRMSTRISEARTP